MIKRILQKIEWKTRRWNLKINLLDIYLHDGDACWGFTLLEVSNNYVPYSLLSFEVRLPNGADRKILQVTNWDFFFLSTPFYNWCRDEDERILWGGATETGIKGIFYKLGNKLFR